MSRPRVLSLAELRALELPPRDDLIEDLVPRGSLSLLVGREKAGKSLFGNDLALSVALDETFLDLAVQASPVMLVPAEENIREIRSRIETRLAGRTDAPVYVLPAAGQTQAESLRLDDPVTLAELADAIATYEPAIVVLDPLRELHGGAENDADDMAPVLRPIRQLAYETNTAIVIIHHANKNGGPRGSTAILAACDQEIAFERTDGADDATDATARVIVRGRFGPRQVLRVRLNSALRWERDVSEPSFGEGGARDRILAALTAAADGFTAKSIAEKLADLKPKTVQNRLSDMLREAVPPIVSVGSGARNDPRRYRLSEPPLITDDMFPPDENPRGRARGEPFADPFPPRSRSGGNQQGNDPYRVICPTCGGPKTKGYPCSACAARSKHGAET